MTVSRKATCRCASVALLYLTLLSAAAARRRVLQTFEHGFGDAWGWMTTPAAISALWLTVLVAVIAVPLNTIFGVGAALVIVRGKGRGAQGRSTR